jgi:hypothetical protein
MLTLNRDEVGRGYADREKDVSNVHNKEKGKQGAYFERVDVRCDSCHRKSRPVLVEMKCSASRFELLEAGVVRKRRDQYARGSGGREDGEQLLQRSMSEYEVDKIRTWRRVSTALVTTSRRHARVRPICEASANVSDRAHPGRSRPGRGHCQSVEEEDGGRAQRAEQQKRRGFNAENEHLRSNRIRGTIPLWQVDRMARRSRASAR